MSETLLTSQRYTINYKTGADWSTRQQILASINALVHRKLGADSKIIAQIVLQTLDTIAFDQPEITDLNDNRIPANDRFIKLSSLIQHRDVETIQVFLDLLINLKSLENFSNIIKQEIENKFKNVVEIVVNENVQITTETCNRKPVPQTYRDQQSIHPSQIKKSSTENQLLLLDDQQRSQRPSRSCKRSKIFIILIAMAILFIVIWLLLIPVIGTNADTPLTNVSSKQSSDLIDKNPASFNNAVMSGNWTTSGVVNLRSFEPERLNHSDPVLNTSITSLVTSSSPLVQVYNKTETAKLILTVKVSSYKEYTEIMRKLNENREAHVTISLDSPFDWPTQPGSLAKSLEITKLVLDGPFTVDVIVYILSQTPNIKELQIKNTHNRLCQRNQGQLSLVKGIVTRVHLPVLKVILFKGLTSCSEVYETLALTINELQKLEVLAFHKSLVDDANHFFIQQFISRSCSSLRRLQLTEATIITSDPLFEIGAGIRLRHLRLLRLDSLQQNSTDDSIIPLGKEFIKFYPNLRVLTSNYGYILWRNMPNVLIATNLTKLQIGVRVPSDHPVFHLSFLGWALPKLNSFNLTLHHPHCSDVNATQEVAGWEAVKDQLEEVTIRSNCKFHISTISPEMRNRRMEKYTRANGKFVFTYRLIE